MRAVNTNGKSSARAAAAAASTRATASPSLYTGARLSAGLSSIDPPTRPEPGKPDGLRRVLRSIPEAVLEIAGDGDVDAVGDGARLFQRFVA